MTTTPEFSAQFRQLRKQRDLSILALSKHSGISKTTLDNWQSGRTLPSAPELEMLISVLNLSSPDQRLLRRSIGLPRAIVLLPEGERPPLTGGLLRAMRLRRGLTQSDVARRLSVRQGTLAKWEKSDDWPEADKLSTLCMVLRASYQEAEAILSGVFLPLPLPLNATREELEQKVWALRDRSLRLPNDPLLDLAFLELESQLWLGGDHPATQELLWRTWNHHIDYLRIQYRYAESLPYVNALLGIPFSPINRSGAYLQTAVILKAQALRGAEDDLVGKKQRWKRAITFLNANQAHVVDNECKAWFWMELVRLNIGVSAHQVAQTCLTLSNAIPHHQCVRGTMGESALLTAHHLTKLGKPRDALVLLDSQTIGREDNSFTLIMDMLSKLYRADALANLQDTTGALGALSQLYNQIEETGVDMIRHRADELFIQLAQ